MIGITGKIRQRHIGAALAISYLLYNIVFWAYPFFWLIILSFSDWRFFSAPTFTGLSNFLLLLDNTEFWGSLWNVARFLGFYLPITFACSLAFAFGLQHLGRGKAFVALCFLLAHISSGVAYSLVFTKIFSANGPLNGFLFEWFGFKIPWLTSPSLAMLSISLIVTWKFVGYYGLILYSGLASIPREIYDAAELDNTSALTRLFRITLPMINAQMIMVLVLAVIVSFGIFTEPYMMTEGGPLESTNMPLMVMYETAFLRLQPSRAALMSIIIAAASFLVIKLVRKFLEREVALT